MTVTVLSSWWLLGVLIVYAVILIIFLEGIALQGVEESSMRNSCVASFFCILESFTSRFATDEAMYETCKYEGHCAVGFTCVKSYKSFQGGICHPYRDEVAASLPIEGQNANNDCVRQCLHHVTWNEQFYWEASPNITRSELASHDSRRPAGCLVRYRRNLDHVWPDFSLEKWQDATHDRRIVRVDPVGEPAKTAHEQEWTAFCYEPCRTDSDCGASDAFTCVDTVCRRRGSYWNRTDSNEQQAEMVLVSGANSKYFKGLKNLAGSVQYWAPGHRLVVFNLGMSPEQIAEVESWPVVLDIKWKDGFPKHFPPHTHKGKVYAWKPLAINESVHEYHSIFWLDAGSTLVGPLDEVERILQETGIFLVHGQGLNMKGKSHEKMYHHFGQNKTTFHGGPPLGGNTQAHMYPSRYIDTIVRPMATCAMEKRCISPEGAHLGNHRYDQTSLSILAYMPHVQAPHHTEYLAGAAHQLNKDLHKSSGRFIVWTARQACITFQDEAAREVVGIGRDQTSV